jgi:hypothetical protein
MKYLETLQQRTADQAGDWYLWPDTPLQTIQTRIKIRVGADDTEIDNPASRTYRIIAALRAIKPTTILDICCGDALILTAIKLALPDVACYGVDINAGAIPGNREAHATGVKLYRVALQLLVEHTPPQLFGVTMMLNTYRGWKDARLRQGEEGLPERVTTWLANSSVRSVLTVNPWQFKTLAGIHYIQDIGPGEGDKSRLVVVTWG